MYVFNWFAGPITSQRVSQNGLSPARKTSQVRQASLDRDVFYFDNDRREEVVTYKKPPVILGASVKKFGLVIYLNSNLQFIISYSVVHRFRQAKFPKKGSILSSSQFLLLPKAALKMNLATKVL
jgi:hypothetical protein